MKLLLLYDIENLGRSGDVVDVRRGYARNYLLPKKLAVLPTKGSTKLLELARRKRQNMELRLKEESSKVKAKIEEISPLEIRMRANEDGILYGSVTKTLIREQLKDQGIQIDTKNIQLNQPIKKIGEYSVKISLHSAEVELKLNINPENKTESVADSKNEENSIGGENESKENT